MYNTPTYNVKIPTNSRERQRKSFKDIIPLPSDKTNCIYNII